MSEPTINLTFDQLAGLLERIEKSAPRPVNSFGYCVVRGDRSGVFAGNVESINDQTVVMTDVRRLWYWDGAASVTELAERGTAKPDNCKFTAPATRIRLLDAIEVNTCTEAAEASLRSVPEWSAFQ